MNQSELVPQKPIWPIIQPFVTGGFAGSVSSFILFPIDTMKIRIQIKSEELGKTADRSKVSFANLSRELYRTSGFRGFYKGVDSSIARQLVFSTSRLGIYRTIADKIKEEHGSVSTAQKFLAAFIAGFIATTIAIPIDVAMVRMQADPTLPPLERRNYTNVVNTLGRIIKEEGHSGLWKGSFPTIARGIVINLGILAPYDEIKEKLNAWTGTVDTVSTQLIAGAGSGFIASFLSLPFDNIKTKLQKMKSDYNGNFPYNGLFDGFKKTCQREGFSKLWVGFGSFYSRTAPHVMITFLIMEFIAKWSKKDK